MNEKFSILIQIFVPNGPIKNRSALVPVMARHETGGKQLPETMLILFIDAYIFSARNET